MTNTRRKHTCYRRRLQTSAWVLGTTLNALGFGVVSSPNGEQALLEMGTRRFDAVLLDVNMPGMGGIETCRRMRKKAPLLPILMLTVRDRGAG